jgi:hypothetical protein
MTLMRSPFMQCAVRAVLVSVVAAGAVVLPLAASPAAAATTTTTVTFSATGQSVQQWVVPNGVTSVVFDVRGASGAGAGGLAGRVTGNLAVSEGTTLDIWVGFRGAPILSTVDLNAGGAGGWGGRNGMRHGGDGGVGYAQLGPGAPVSSAGNGGGGATEVDLHDGTNNPAVLLLGGGGGGAGGLTATTTCGSFGAGGCGAQGPTPGLNNGGLGLNGVIGPPGLSFASGAGGGGGNSAGGFAGPGSGGVGSQGSGVFGEPFATGGGGAGGTFGTMGHGGGGGGGGYGGGGGGGGVNSTGFPSHAGGGGSGRSLGPVDATFGAAAAVGDGQVTLTFTAPVAPVGATRFVPLSPFRLLDTRNATDITGGQALAAGGGIDLQVAGRGGVPSSNVAAVVLNVTAAGALAPGFVTVWPTLQTRPVVSNLNVTAAGQNIANLVTVRLGAGGKVSLFSQTGTDLIADIAGYYEPVVTNARAGRYTPLAPVRILDTRSSLGVPGATPVPANSKIDLVVAGRGGVPASGVAAVVLNVTAAEALAPGFVTVWPAGIAQPTASTLNVTAVGQNIANLVIVPLGTNGSVSLYTQGGSHLLADVAGWFSDATLPSGLNGLFHPLDPARVLDTRNAVGIASTTPIPAGTAITLNLGGVGGAPTSGMGAAVLNVTAAAATGAGFITVWPSDKPRPVVSNINVTFAGQNIPNLATVTVSNTNTVSLYTQAGTHLIADIAGYYGT